MKGGNISFITIFNGDCFYNRDSDQNFNLNMKNSDTFLILVTIPFWKFFPIRKPANWLKMSAGKSTILNGLPCIHFDDDILGYLYTDGNSQR